MRIGVIILGIISSLVLFFSGCTGAFIFEAGGEIFDDDTSSLVAAGIVAMASSPFILVGGALPYALRKTCFVLLLIGSVIAWVAFAVDLQSAFAFLYLFGAVMTSVAALLAAMSLRRGG